MDPMSEPLAERHCVPCEGGVPPMEPEEAEAMLAELEAGWEIADDHHLTRGFDFDDFAEALEFVNAVGEVAEAEGHHPVITFTWGEATVEIWTHAIDGLSENDFILAAKIDEL
jgi:4a-hydroxytetrahydrobiopterin dehydratase